MFQKIKNFYDRCLTDYPLLWNTRLPWMFLALIIGHLLFFLGGFISVDIPTLKRYHSVTDIGGSSLYWFSVLCSIGFLLVWLVFLLRNNAFKVYYQVKKYYFLQQWIILFFIVAGSISFFDSFYTGAAVKIRKLIPKETLVKEANILNRGISFMPVNRFDYFIMNNCDNDSIFYESESLYSFEKGIHSNEVETVENNERYYGYDSVILRKIKEALRRPDAFRHSYYCKDLVKLSTYNGFVSARDRQPVRQQWITGSNRDSIRSAVQQVLDLFKKYSLRHNFSADSIAQLSLSDTTLHIPYLDDSRSYYGEYSEFDPESGAPDPYKYQRYLIGRFHYLKNEMQGILGLADERYHGENRQDDRDDIWTVLFYVAMFMSLLLFTYRLFSRKVFLWSIITTLILTIIISLFSITGDSAVSFATSVFVVYIILLILALITHAEKSGSKILSGVTLTLLAWILPYLALFMLVLADNYLSDHTIYDMDGLLRGQMLQERYPISYWITNHTMLIARSNLLIVFLLIAFVYPRFARRWHGKAEE